MATSQWIRRSMAVGVVLVLFSASTACYGPFNLTRTVHKWNGTVKGSGEVSAKWMKELIFLALVIVPVYQVSTLADVLVFNSIEFWSGDNPIKVADQDVPGDTRRAVVVRSADGRVARIEYRRGAEVVGTARIAEAHGRYRLFSEQGEERLSVEATADGGLTVLDPNGRVLETISAERVEQTIGGDARL